MSRHHHFPDDELLRRRQPRSSVEAAGAAFDIHFRVLDQNTNVVVLQSDCHQFLINL